MAQEYHAALDSSAGTQLDGVSGDRVLGLVAQAMGEDDGAAQHFEAPPGLLPQSRLATRAGLDLLRLLGYVERQIRRMRPCQSHVPAGQVAGHLQ